MTQDEMLSKFKLKIEEDAPEDLLRCYLEEAQEVIHNKLYPYAKELMDIPVKYHNKQISIAVYLYGKNGAEGETMHTEGQVTRMYEKGDVPDSMLKDIMTMCGSL